MIVRCPARVRHRRHLWYASFGFLGNATGERRDDDAVGAPIMRPVRWVTCLGDDFALTFFGRRYACYFGAC